MTLDAGRLLRILVAEDNAVSRRLVLHLLQKLGHSADGVENGHQALSALERETYDLVLMDVHMPELDGLAAAREIRRRWAAQAPRIVGLTASNDPQDLADCRAAGMQDCLSKPVGLEDLGAFLDGRCAPESAVAATPPLVLNRTRLARLTELGEPGLVAELIGNYRRQAAELQAELRVAVQAGDVARAHELAHSLRGASGMLGVDAVEAVCSEIEHAAAVDRSLLARLDEQLAHAYLALRASS